MPIEKFVVPYIDHSGNIRLVKDAKNNPVLHSKEEAEKIIKPVRDLINENDKRRSA